ncbi:MAG: hypothetical protein HXX80_05025 [Nitrososphaerales archaeon]|nr:hypothetical protein [Nitrososphaerales archaeon]
MNQVDKLFWTRVLLGIASGLLSGIIASLGGEIYGGLSIVLIVYAISYLTARYVVRMNLPQQEFRKIFTTGLSSFVALWLFTWIVYNTLMTL